MPAMTKSTKAVTPEIWFPKYNPTIIIAANILIILSMLPILLFMFYNF